jgi:Xaa-Pro aminopeptidase
MIQADARADRHRRLREHMSDAGISTLVSTSIDSFTYMTGVWCSAYPAVPTRRMFAVTTEDGFFAITSSADPTPLRQAGIEDMVLYRADEDEPAAVLLSELERRGLLGDVIGVELPELDAAVHARLMGGMEGRARVVDGWPPLLKTRMIKDDVEVAELGRLGKIAAEATRLAAERTRAGDTEIDFVRHANDYAVMHEMYEGGVLTMGSGPRAGIHHTAATSRKLERGDIVRVDLSRRGPLGYHGDIGRTLFVGDPAPLQEERFHVLAAGLGAIEQGLVPGARIGDAAIACQHVFASAGYGAKFRLHGHGMGLTLHEEPVIEPDCDLICQPNMVFAAEAVLKIGLDEATLAHDEQYHLESLVHVTESGNEILASAGKDVLTIAS